MRTPASKRLLSHKRLFANRWRWLHSIVHFAQIDRVTIYFTHCTILYKFQAILYYLELLKQFLACIEHFMTKNILFTINPQIRKPLLGRIKYLSQIAQWSLFVKYFVSLAKLVSIRSRCKTSFKYFTKSWILINRNHLH